MQRKTIIAISIIILVILVVALVTIFIFKYPIKPSIPDFRVDFHCSSDIYNCDDFPTYADAKDVYDLCFEIYGDIHQLDKDGNGEPCESLE